MRLTNVFGGINMDTYVKFREEGFVKIGKNSAKGAEKVCKEIIEGISKDDGGALISFKPLNDADFERLTECFDNPVKYGEESYIIEINDNITIYYTAPITKLYALYTIKRHYTRDGIKKGIIYNTPKVPIRFYRCYLPGRDRIDEYKRIIDMCIAFGYNAIMMEIGGAMEYKRHPEISEGWVEYCNSFTGRGFENGYAIANKIMEYPKTSLHCTNGGFNYLTQEQLKDIVDYCAERHIEIIPEVPSFSHANYILFKHPEMSETTGDPIPDVACPLNEEYQAIVRDILDEVVEVFKPKRVNICHDEIYVIGHCPKCREQDPNKLFADDVTRMHDHLAKLGVKTMMWGDGLLDARGCEAYHQRLPWDGKTEVELFGKTYKIHGFKWRSKEEFEKMKAEDPTVEGWHVPRKGDAVKYIPKDIQVINWYWGWYTPGDDELKAQGLSYCYGNFLATGETDFEKKVKKGCMGVGCSNWSGITIEEAQRADGLFCIPYNSLACWCEYYDDNKRTEYIMQAADALYQNLNFDTLMGKHLEITHTTDAFIEHSIYFSKEKREDFRMGDYEITYTDGSSEKLPIYWGYNVTNSNIGWGYEEEGYTFAVGKGSYMTPYVFEAIGSSKPVLEGEKTWHRMVVPVDKDVKEITFKPIDGYSIEVKEWSVK